MNAQGVVCNACLVDWLGLLTDYTACALLAGFSCTQYVDRLTRHRRLFEVESMWRREQEVGGFLGKSFCSSERADRARGFHQILRGHDVLCGARSWDCFGSLGTKHGNVVPADRHQ